VTTCPTGLGALVWPTLHAANSAPTTDNAVITTPRLTSPDTVFRPPVAGHDLLTRTGTIQFRDLLQERFSLPPRTDKRRRARRLDTCVPTHGDIARLLVG
jgi:hypothetical protein